MMRKKGDQTQFPYRLHANQIAALLREPEAQRILGPALARAEERRQRIFSPFTELRVHVRYKSLVDRILDGVAHHA